MSATATTRGRFHIDQAVRVRDMGRGRIKRFHPQTDSVLVRFDRNGLEIYIAPSLVTPIQEPAS